MAVGRRAAVSRAPAPDTGALPVSSYLAPAVGELYGEHVELRLAVTEERLAALRELTAALGLPWREEG